MYIYIWYIYIYVHICIYKYTYTSYINKKYIRIIKQGQLAILIPGEKEDETNDDKEDIASMYSGNADMQEMKGIHVYFFVYICIYLCIYIYIYVYICM
jgi:hypothetical protein